MIVIAQALLRFPPTASAVYHAGSRADEVGRDCRDAFRLERLGTSGMSLSRARLEGGDVAVRFLPVFSDKRANVIARRSRSRC